MQLINYKTFKLQYYLFNPMFNNESRNLLFRLRTRTVSGIKSDFKGIYSDTTCPMRCGQDDTIPHILSCTVLGSHQKSINISLGKPSKKKGQTWAFGSTSADPLIRCNFQYFCVFVCLLACCLLCVCTRFLIRNIPLFKIFQNIQREREISFQKLRTDKQQKYVLSCCATKNCT